LIRKSRFGGSFFSYDWQAGLVGLLRKSFELAVPAFYGGLLELGSLNQMPVRVARKVCSFLNVVCILARRMT